MKAKEKDRRKKGSKRTNKQFSTDINTGIIPHYCLRARTKPKFEVLTSKTRLGFKILRARLETKC